MKRILSAVLCAVLLLALCPAALAVDSDYAAYYLTEYQIQSGDTLTSICESRGVKYAEYATAIRNVNGLTNPNALVAGRTLWLPTRTLGEAERYYTVYRHVLVPGDTVSALCATYGTSLKAVQDMTMSLNGVTNLTSFMAGTCISFPVPGGTLATAAPAATTTTTTPTAATGTTTAAQTSVTAQTGDYVAFYLTSYTCQSGDTLTSICQSRGVTYANYKGLILSLNKLASETSLIAGRSYWMPTASLDGAAVYYTVYRHLLVSGDTMYALCNAYGINMQKYTDLILKLNNKKNLTSFMAGTAVYLPVYCANGTVGTGTAVPGTGTGLDESTAGVGGGKVTTQTGVDANGNPVTVTTTTSTTVSELPGLFDATASANFCLVPYTVKAGDSLIGICNDLGSSFSKNKNILVAANGLQSYNVPVGTTLYVPVASANGAARYYSVSIKTIQFGDTVYGYYCNANADFSVNYKMLTDLNGAINFNNLPVGGKLAIPVLVG